MDHKMAIARTLTVEPTTVDDALAEVGERHAANDSGGDGAAGGVIDVVDAGCPDGAARHSPFALNVVERQARLVVAHAGEEIQPGLVLGAVVAVGRLECP